MKQSMGRISSLVFLIQNHYKICSTLETSGGGWALHEPKVFFSNLIRLEGAKTNTPPKYLFSHFTPTQRPKAYMFLFFLISTTQPYVCAIAESVGLSALYFRNIFIISALHLM